MKSKILGFTFLIISFLGYTQLPSGWTPGDITLSDGTTKKGWFMIFRDDFTIQAFHSVRYKPTDDGKKEKYKYDEIDHIKVNDSIRLEYRKIKRNRWHIFRIKTEGKVDLLLSEMIMNVRPGGALMGGGGFVNDPFNYIGFNAVYVQKKDEDEATPLLRPGVSTPFKKAAKKYFKDCKSIVNKIKDKTYNKKNIEEMVKDYNDGC